MAGEQKSFTKTGEVVVEAGLDQDGDMAWRAHHDGMNPLEVIGATVVVAARMVLRMTLPGIAAEEAGGSTDADKH